MSRKNGTLVNDSISLFFGLWKLENGMNLIIGKDFGTIGKMAHGCFSNGSMIFDEIRTQFTHEKLTPKAPFT